MPPSSSSAAAASTSTSASASTSSSPTSSSDYSQNTVDYSLDHTRAHNPHTPSSASELTSLSADSPLEAEESMISCALQILSQAIDLLRSPDINDEALSRPSRGASGGTVGKHLRHVLDHYRLLLDSVEQAGEEGEPYIDYDRRVRSVPIETSVPAALKEFEATQRRLRDVLSTPPGSRTTANANATPSMQRPVTLQATTPIIQEFKSTVGREVWHVALHSIHHFALARVILNELGVGDSVSKEFGVAPSTLAFRQWAKQSGVKDEEKRKKKGGGGVGGRAKL